MAVLLGQKERESGVAIVKDLVERSQKEVPLADLPSVLKGETP
jgi:histidyl-tRNA synthetase